MNKLIFVLALVTSGNSQLLAQQVLVELGGFEKPESALYWEEKRAWLVSNVGPGGPTEKSGRGYLSLVNEMGNEPHQKWLEGLNAPKGLCWSEGRLFVADVDRVVEIDPTGPRIIRIVSLPGAKFLNDLVHLPGYGVVVSDTQAGALFLVTENGGAQWLKIPELGGPNGLWWDGQRLVLAQFRGAKGPGQLWSLDPARPEILQKLSSLQGSLDGVANLVPRGLLVSDYQSGKIYLVENDVPALFWSGKKGTADLGVSTASRLIAVPNMEKGVLTILENKRP